MNLHGCICIIVLGRYSTFSFSQSNLEARKEVDEGMGTTPKPSACRAECCREFLVMFVQANFIHVSAVL